MSSSTDSDRQLSTEQLEEAHRAECFDKEGTKTTFGELVKGRGRVLVVFIRHFWCSNCQIYTHHLSKSIPAQSLPEGTSIIVIGCGSFSPISSYIQTTSCPYPIYANSSLSLHKTFQFVSNLKGASSSTPPGYMADAGSLVKRTWGVVSSNLFKNPGHAMESVRGPNNQNGGELIFENDGTCSSVHRMQNTEDHTDIKVLADKLGAKFVPLTDEEKKWSP